MSVIIITPPPPPKKQTDLADGAVGSQESFNDYESARSVIDAAEAAGMRVRIIED